MKPEPRDDDLPTSISGPLKKAAYFLLAAFGLFFLWMALAPLEEGVVMPGMVSADGSKVVVQHNSGGGVEQVLVREGEMVVQDQVLVVLDSQSVRTKIKTVTAQIRGVESLQESLRGVSTLNKNRVDSLRDEKKTIVQLVQDGFFPPAKLRDFERELLSFEQQFADSLTKQVELEGQRLELTETLTGLKFDLDSVNIRAPVEGSVIKRYVNGPGAVVSPGGPVVDILPRQRRMIVEGQLTPNAVIGLAAGQPATVRFTSISSRESPSLEGEVEFVSPDAILAQDGSLSFTVRVAVIRDQNPDLFDRAMQPGIPAEVLVKKGSHTVLQYLLKAISDQSFRSLRET
jgi:multidrug resistance efflux pump